MTSIARHSIAFGRVLTIVFLIVSSHFTAIMHKCVRKVSDCCCVISGEKGHDAFQKKARHVADMSIYIVDGCRSIVDIGDLTVVLASDERDSKVQNVKVLHLLSSPFVSPAPGNTSSWFSYSFFESVSPRSVEKYVLNETFLI